MVFAGRRRLIEFTAERGSYRGCRCTATQGTESCEEEDDMEALVSEISKIGTAPKPQMHLRTPGTHLLRAIGAIGRPKGCCCEPQGCSERSVWKICTRPGWTHTFGTRLPGELRCSFTRYTVHVEFCTRKRSTLYYCRTCQPGKDAL